MVEKHVTLDKNANGPDHKASIDIVELQSLVSSIRHIEVAMGTRERSFSESQDVYKRQGRESLRGGAGKCHRLEKRSRQAHRIRCGDDGDGFSGQGCKPN